MSDNIVLSNTTQPTITWAGSSDLTSTGVYTIDPKYWEYYDPSYSWLSIENNKKGDDDMRYLYEVILVNPKNDTFYKDCIVARSETFALMTIYNESSFNKSCEVGLPCDTISFDDLKTSCRILMEWKKEKSLKKAIETIKKAVE